MYITYSLLIFMLILLTDKEIEQVEKFVGVNITRGV